MAATTSTMLPLGTKAPPFSLPDAATGRTVTSEDFGGARALLVMFICNHCPYVVHVRDELGRIAADYAARGLAVVAINANSEASHPQDGPAYMAEMARKLGWDFPFLFDDTQEVAKAYMAACTPDFFLFDAERKLAYRGQLDDSRPGNGKPVDGRDLRRAIDLVLDGSKVPEEQRPSIGCNIKWKAGNAPAYVR
jgi:peroxiredoxin